MTTQLVSKNTDSTQSDGLSDAPAVSGDGQHIVFSSYATTLVAGSIEKSQIYLHDAATGVTTLVSKSDTDSPGNRDSILADISANGRFVVYQTQANNLLADDASIDRDVLLYDALTDQTTLISQHSDGTKGNAGSSNADISGDGQYVVFSSSATNLVNGDLNGFGDVFLRDTVNGTTTLVSQHTDGTQANASSFGTQISADGRYIVYQSTASNLVDGDTNAQMDVFLYDTQTSTTTLVSKSSDGTQGNGVSRDAVISDDGQFIVYESVATNLVSDDTNGARDLFRYDINTGTTSRVVQQPDGTTFEFIAPNAPSLSGDGRFVTFESDAYDAVSDAYTFQQVFVYDFQTGNTSLVSQSAGGGENTASSNSPAISSDGESVVYYSNISDLVAGDTNSRGDIFITDNPLFDTSSSGGGTGGGNGGWTFGWNVGWYYGWGSGWYYGWNAGWYYGWGQGWQVSWYYGWSNTGSGWALGWAYGWNVGWSLSWHYGWNLGWANGWHVGWHYGWNAGWYLA
ncbi:MAG: hypothetical protein AAFO61_08070 [Pseudomonadota bacterium]